MMFHMLWQSKANRCYEYGCARLGDGVCCLFHVWMPCKCTLTFFFSFLFIFISWRLITLQYYSGFCHTLTWISHGCTWVPHPDPPSRLPPHPIPLGLPSAPAPSTCLMHPTWAGDLFHPWWYTCFNAVLSEHPTLAFSHRVQESVLYIWVSFCFAYRVIVTIFLNSIYMC